MKKALRITAIVLGVFLLLVLVGPFLVPVPELEGLAEAEELADPDSRFTNIAFPGTDGITIHYKVGGTGEPVFILLHGFSSSLYAWDDVFAAFGERGTVYAYDRPPFGLSERLLRSDWSGPNPYTDEAAVEQLMAFLDAMEVDNAILVGNSAGGLVALQAAAAHPERVDGIILANPAVYSGGAPAGLSTVANTPQMRHLGPLISRSFAGNETLLEQSYHDPTVLTPESRERAAIGTRVRDWDKAFWEFTAAASGSAEVTERLDSLTLPILIASGEDDGIVPVEQHRQLAAELPNAELVLIPACGHVPQDECPGPFMEAVDRWLAAR